jgi:hypothetical protein
MRRAELLLTQVQRATENERGSGTADGISPEEYYQYFTDGLRAIQRAIVGPNSKAFRTYTTWSADGTEDYDLPFDYFARNQIATLEYSQSGNAQDYYKLEKRTQLERFSETGAPSQYVMEGKRILVNAYPATGTFRLTYVALLPAVDKRRGTVASKTLTSGVLSALTITPSGAFVAADYLLADHLCIVDFNGNITCRKIPYTAVSGAGVLTIQGTTYTVPTGSSIAVGDYVCLGEYATTHFQIDDQAEDFLLAYCQKRIFNRDSSSDAVEMDAEMRGMLAAIVEVYSDDADTDEVPVTNYNYFDDLG